MNLVELQRALRQLRCSGMAAGLETRLLEAQTERLAPIDFLSTLVQDELQRRQDRLLDRRITQAGFRDRGKTLDAFDFEFNKKMNRRLVFELATGRFVTQHEDGLFLGPPGTGKSHLAQAIGFAVIQQGHRVLYREAHVLLEELADAQLAGTRKDYLTHVTITEDPIFLEEPLVKTTNHILDLNTQPAQYQGWLVCQADDEVPGRDPARVPHHLPGQNPFIADFAKRHGLPFEATRGGAATMYPEFLKRMQVSTR